MKTYNVCIVGGGSTYTLGFLKSFVRLRDEFPLKKLVLFDIDGERQEPTGDPVVGVAARRLLGHPQEELGVVEVRRHVHIIPSRT